MKSITNKTMISSLCLALSSQCVLADPPVSDAFSPGESESKWILGAEAHYLNNPYVHDDDSDEDRLGILNFRAEYRGERLFFDDSGFGITLVRANGFSTGLILSADYNYLSDEDNYEDNYLLNGIKEREITLDLGVYLIHNSEFGQLKITASKEITDEHDGQTFDIKYSTNIPLGRWNITPAIGATWSSKDTVKHFYGVSESEATANRAAYNGDSSTNVYGKITARYDINDKWDVSISQSYVSFGDGMADSPLIEDDYEAMASVGVHYNF